MNNTNNNEAVLTGVLIALVSFPFVLVLLVALGLASFHGDGLPYVLIGSSALGVLATFGCKRNEKFARTISILLVCMMGLLIVQAIYALLRK
jgi:hypothetical protein